MPHGVEPARLDAGYLAVVGGFALAIGAVVFATGMLVTTAVAGGEAAGWWWLALAVPAAAAALVAFSGVFAEGTARIMVASTVALVGWTGVAAGAAIGTAALAVTTNGPAPVIAALLALTAVALGVLAAASTRRARREVARILRLRADPAPAKGMITALPDPATWNHGGDVPVRYDPGDGERTVTVRMTSYAHEIPVRGTRVWVYGDGTGDVHVELDPQHPPVYEKNSRPYESDDSGGGS